MASQNNKEVSPLTVEENVEEKSNKKRTAPLVTVQSFLENFQNGTQSKKSLKYLIPGFIPYVTKAFPGVRVKTTEEWNKVFIEYSQKGEDE